MLFMRKRVALTIALFHVAGKVFIHLPLLTLQPFCTFLALVVFWLYWILVLLFLATTGEEEGGCGVARRTGAGGDMGPGRGRTPEEEGGGGCGGGIVREVDRTV